MISRRNLRFKYEALQLGPLTPCPTPLLQGQTRRACRAPSVCNSPDMRMGPLQQLPTNWSRPWQDGYQPAEIRRGNDELGCLSGQVSSTCLYRERKHWTLNRPHVEKFGVVVLAYGPSGALISTSANNVAGTRLKVSSLRNREMPPDCPTKEQFRFSCSHHLSARGKTARRWGSAKMFGKETRCEEVRYSWKMPDGTSCRMTLFDVTTSEAEDVAKACGWPGRGLLQAGHARRGSATASPLSI